MAANSLSYNQIATFLNAVVSQATGKTGKTPVNMSEFATVAQEGLKTGYDNLMNSVSQILTKTIFSTRPYTRKFKGLEADSLKWGNHVRKINYIDGEWVDNAYLPIVDGQAVETQKPTKPLVVQTNFYGQNDYQVDWTIFRDQLITAFSSPDELGSFVTGQTQNISDRIEQKNETLARAILCNLITGTISIGNPNQVIHLLTEYNAYTGNKLTATTAFSPENFAPFMRWVYGRIATASSMLTERCELYHQNIDGKVIMRHTPAEFQRVYLYAPLQYQVDANVLSTTFHDNFLTMPVTERVNFWQSIKAPDEINNTPVYMDTDGTLKSPEAAVDQKNVFGIIADSEAAGYTIANYRNTTEPYNGNGEYQNFHAKFTDRYWNDFTENAIVLLLD